MDGLIVTIISSSVVIGGAIGSGFWRLGRSIGRLEGKMDGFDSRIGNMSDRIDHLDTRINGLAGDPPEERK